MRRIERKLILNESKGLGVKNTMRRIESDVRSQLDFLIFKNIEYNEKN